MEQSTEPSILQEEINPPVTILNSTGQNLIQVQGSKL